MRKSKIVFKETIKRTTFVSVLLAGMLLLPQNQVTADASANYGMKLEGIEGTCGAEGNENGVTWAVYDSNADGDGIANTGDTLVFEGKGKMRDFSYTVGGERVPWYSYRTSLTQIIFAEDSQVTSIGNYAFSNCDSLPGVNIPESVTDMGAGVFDGCESLIRVNIPEGVTSIGEETFSWCKKLSSIDIPESVTSIGEEAFSFCYKLTEIELPEGVTSIGEDAFQACEELTSIELPKSVTSIGEGAFQGCENLTSIELPESVTNIEYGTFAGCSGLTNISIPASVTTIGDYAFSSCSGLVSINLPESVTTIGSSAFARCSSLSEINIPESVTTIGNSAFKGCSGLSEISIPERVTTIENYAFACCSSLSEINIPESVITIGNGAFEGCSGLSEISIPESVTTIGSSAFSECSSLTGINIPENVTVIAQNLFNGCSSLKGVNISKKVTNIGCGAFAGCSNMTNIVIPEGITDIEGGAFVDCAKLVIQVDDANTRYCAENGILYNKDKSILITYPAVTGECVIPEGVTTIGEAAFYGCSNITSVSIPEGVTTIGEEAFSNCKSLTNVNIPDSVTSIGSNAFLYCRALSSVAIPKNITNLASGLFWGCESLVNVTIPDSVTTIETKVFYASGLSSIVIPDSVESIGGEVFACCGGLTSVVMPKEIKGFGGSMFAFCTRLREVYYPVQAKVTPLYFDFIEKPILYISYEINEDNTLSLTVTGIPKEPTSVTLPADINGRTISSLSFAEGIDSSSVAVSCGKHLFTKKESGSDKDCHWEKVCSICGHPADTKKEHDFVDGKPCECGYIPFTIATQPQNVETAYSYKEGEALSVSVAPAYENLDITYQWYEDNKPVEGATKSTYTIEKKKGVGNYKYYCEISCGKYSINSNVAEVSIIKADYPETTPDTPKTVANTVKKVSEVTLSTDWQWDREDAGKTLPAGKEVEVTANYIGEDKEYYNYLSMKVTLQRAECVCSEVLYTGEGEKKPTCITEGTGHKECTVCGDILEKDIIVPVVKHTINKVSKVEATCTAEGVDEHWKCSGCDKLYEDEEGAKEIEKAMLIIPSTGHKETEIRNKKEATCKEDGYTGDVCCKACGEKLTSGEKKEKLDHAWDNGVVTKEATEKENGIKTYTCTKCQETKIEEIPAIQVTITEVPTLSPTKAPTTIPTEVPTEVPTTIPTEVPTTTPTEVPTITPTTIPTVAPTIIPTVTPTEAPTEAPTVTPTEAPTATPTQNPSKENVAPKNGTVLVDEKTQAKYKVVVSDTKNGTVEYVKLMDKKATKVTVPSKVTMDGITYKVVSIGKNAFKNHKNITKVTIKSNVEVIGANAFYGCKKLKTVSISKSVVTIGEKAFYKCTALTTITIPSKVKTIGKQAFYGCEKLKSITVKTTKLTTKSVGSKAFTGIYKKATIKVPKSKLKIYQKMLKTKGINKAVKIKK